MEDGPPALEGLSQLMGRRKSLSGRREAGRKAVFSLAPARASFTDLYGIYGLVFVSHWFVHWFGLASSPWGGGGVVFGFLRTHF